MSALSAAVDKGLLAGWKRGRPKVVDVLLGAEGIFVSLCSHTLLPHTSQFNVVELIVS